MSCCSTLKCHTSYCLRQRKYLLLHQVICDKQQALGGISVRHNLDDLVILTDISGQSINPMATHCARTDGLLTPPLYSM